MVWFWSRRKSLAAEEESDELRAKVARAEVSTREVERCWDSLADVLARIAAAKGIDRDG